MEWSVGISIISSRSSSNSMESNCTLLFALWNLVPELPKQHQNCAPCTLCVVQSNLTENKCKCYFLFLWNEFFLHLQVQWYFVLHFILFWTFGRCTEVSVLVLKETLWLPLRRRRASSGWFLRQSKGSSMTALSGCSNTYTLGSVVRSDGGRPNRATVRTCFCKWLYSWLILGFPVHFLQFPSKKGNFSSLHTVPPPDIKMNVGACHRQGRKRNKIRC